MLDSIINKIHCADCLEFMKQIDDKSIDLVVTSPPYDNLRNYNGYTFDFEGIAKELYRIIKVGGVVVWVVNDATINGSETGTSFKQALYFKDVGFNLHDTMIYKSAKPPMTHNRYEPEFEYMFILSKGRPNNFNPLMTQTVYYGDIKKYNHGCDTEAKKEKGKAIRRRNSTTVVGEYKIKGNIWEYATGMNGSTRDKIAFEHPAIFPEQLAKDHIISWSNEGDIVLDPFSGSGTTCKMADMLNRKWIGIEISKEYVDISNKRIKEARENMALLCNA